MKFSNVAYPTIFAVSAAFALSMPAPAHADGMVPETSVVILDAGKGETSINVKNSDAMPSLLKTTVLDLENSENLPESADTELSVIPTPSIARVEGGETQLVRFLLLAEKPVEVQQLKRVTFEGIPQRKKKPGEATVGVTVRQNLPLIIHPEGLEREAAPWRLLKWHVSDDHLTVVNDSPYVTRLAQKVVVQPSGTVVDLGQAYLLPGTTKSIPANVAGTTSVTISPATVYGFSVETYDAPVTSGD